MIAFRRLSVCLAAFSLVAGPLHAAAADAIAHPALWPAAASPAAITDPKTEAFITDLMARMSLEEKVGQVIQGDIASITPDDLRRYPLGSILAGGNSEPDGNARATPARWVSFIDAYRKVALEARPGHTPIPILFGIDAVHGHNNVIGATLFPHNVGLGATRDPDLIRRIGAATAEEVAATGGDWTFGPTVAVPRDVRWGRSYEGYAEDPEVVRSYAGPMVLGLQGELKPGQSLASGHIVGSAKHFLADGGTAGGKDQGDAAISEQDLIRLHAQGYPPAIDAGILTVMTSFSSWNGVKHAGNASLITDVLKGRMGFQGFVVSDWNAHGQLPGCTQTDCPAAIKAGLDMYMAPDSWKGLFDSTLAEVRSGVIPMARLDDAVRRVLRVKVKAGLFEGANPMLGRFDRVGSADHRALAREAVRKSLVLLKNNGGVLPIKASARVLVAGDGADNIGKQAGGWTLTWQGTGTVNADFPGGQSIYAGVAEAVKRGGGQAELAVNGRYKTRPDVAIVVFGENPYAEFQGDIASVEYQPGAKTDLALLKRLKAEGIPVVAVFLSGRPLWVNPELNASDAFVAAWLPGTEGEGIADVLIRKPDGAINHDFTGKLSFSWPKRSDQSPLDHDLPGYDPLFAYGYGLTYASKVEVPVLSDQPAAGGTSGSVDRYFVAGRTPTPWRFQLRDAGGATWADAVAASPRGVVALRPIDAGAQENARQATWNGQGEGVVAIEGSAADLSRQTTGDMALMLHYRVDARPAGPVRLGLSDAAHPGASVDLGGLLAVAPVGEWRTLKIKLACFRDAGADMARIAEPLALSTSGPLVLSFSEVRLASNENDAVCPGR